MPGMKIYQGPPIWDGDFSLLGREPETGDTVWIRWHENGSWDKPGSFDIKYTQNVTQLIEENKEAVKETEGKRFGDYRHIGSVPDNIAEASGLNEAWMQKDKKFIKKFFNDSDNHAWRRSRGSV